MQDFDPDATAENTGGIFGLPHSEQQARILLLPVPFEATVSYRTGTAAGPAAILAASRQIDLLDHQTGRPDRAGIHMQEEDPALCRLSRDARRLAAPILSRGGARPEDRDAVAAVDRAGEEVRRFVHREVEATLATGKVPGVVGGDHSVALGGIEAASERHPGLGILQVDAHCDLRPAFSGFTFSHASVMHNVLHRLEGVARIVQVGVRDLGPCEEQAVQESGGRVLCHHALDWQRRRAAGKNFLSICREALEPLPQEVWVSFDIDGLDATLCPHTGTPVPGGLSFAEACLLLETLTTSARRIIGFDLCEVAPGPPGEDLDAIVGARILYKLCGFAALGS